MSASEEHMANLLIHYCWSERLFFLLSDAAEQTLMIRSTALCTSIIQRWATVKYMSKLISYVFVYYDEQYTWILLAFIRISCPFI